MDGIIDSVDTSLSKFWNIVKDRETWCAAVHGVAESWTRLSGWTELIVAEGPPGGISGEELGLQRKRRKRSRFKPWVRRGRGSPFQHPAWRTPQTKEPGGLQSAGSQSAGHN